MNDFFFFWYYYRHTGSLPIHGEASAKAALYRDRLLLLFQRVSRDHHFSKSSFDAETSEFGSCEVIPLSLSLSHFLFGSHLWTWKLWLCFGVAQISTIQSLVGQRGRKWVMGVISQLEDGHFYLEDLTASVEINLSKAISFTYSYFIFFWSKNFMVLLYMKAQNSVMQSKLRYKNHCFSWQVIQNHHRFFFGKHHCFSRRRDASRGNFSG